MIYRFCRPEDIPMIVQAINACYDVHFPEILPMTVAQFRAEMSLISLWPSNTMVVLDYKDPIALIVGTKRPYGCWIAKLGVRSDYQRQGVARDIVEALVRKLSIIGPRVMSVDVLDDNEGGIAFFKAIGFQIWTRYRSFEGCPRPVASKDLRWVRPVKPEVALTRYEPFHPVPQCWERDAHTLRLYGDRLTGQAFWEGEGIIGYILRQNATVMDLAIDPRADPFLIGTALLARAGEDEKAPLCMIKVPEDDPVRRVLEQAGLAPRESHVQLGLQITKKGG